MYLIVEVVGVVGNKDMDIPHNLQHIKPLCQQYIIGRPTSYNTFHFYAGYLWERFFKLLPLPAIDTRSPHITTHFTSMQAIYICELFLKLLVLDFFDIPILSKITGCNRMDEKM